MSTSGEQKYRHELKYLITNAEVQMLRNRLQGLLPVDSHTGPSGSYSIRSLYFDDYQDRCYHENEDGTDPREKFRIRIYNHSAERITLECKRKERGKTLKTACPLTRAQTETLMAGRPLAFSSDMPPLLKKFHLQFLSRQMRPVVIVEYDRIPYVYPMGNVRVTLDTNISATGTVGDFLEERIARRPVLPLGRQLLEVKYDEFLPDFVYSSLQLRSLRQTAFSKYYICRRFTR